MFTGELLEIVSNDLFHLYLHPRWILSANLQEQTLLKRRSANTCGIKPLQQFLHLTQFFLRGIDVMIDGQFITDGIERLTEQPVIIERANQILHDIMLTGSHIEQSHLFLQLVVERGGLTVHHLLTFLCHSTPAVVDGQFVIIAADIAQGVVESRLALLPFCQRLVVLWGIRRIRIIRRLRIIRTVRIIVWRLLFEGGIIVHLRVHTVHQLHQRQLHQRGLKQLLVGNSLRQFLLLQLFLRLTERITHTAVANFSLYTLHFSLKICLQLLGIRGERLHVGIAIPAPNLLTGNQQRMEDYSTAVQVGITVLEHLHHLRHI